MERQGLMSKKEFNPLSAVYTPVETSNYGLAAIRNMKEKKTRGARLPIADIRDYFTPILPGQVGAIIAQTSNYKSAFMHFWERKLADQLVEEERFDEAIIHVSVEEPVEDQSFIFMAREVEQDAGELARGEVQDWSRLEEAATKIQGIPIYRIGDSLARAEDLPDLYLSNMVRSIKSLVTGEVTGNPIKPAAIFFDYLQAFPFDPDMRRAAPTDQRRLQVREDIYRLRQAASYFDCPVVVGVQARQHLEGAPSKDFQLPGIYDGEESSSIAQRCDRIITMWMPKQTHPLGTTIKHGDISFDVEENLIWLKVAKQRGGLPAGKSWKCRINFIDNTIAPEQL
jgi:replicative DNA helicase